MEAAQLSGQGSILRLQRLDLVLNRDNNNKAYTRRRGQTSNYKYCSNQCCGSGFIENIRIRNRSSISREFGSECSSGSGSWVFMAKK
jgi:hypothetical protein